MIVDQAEIHIRAGKGGDGCVSFRREKYIPRGGPDGGDGGDGGSVFVVARRHIETLLDFAGQHHWKAKNGQPGIGKNCAGPSAADLTIELPVGTLIHDRETGVLIKDLSTPDEPVCIAEGGKGGRGNARFASPTNQVPRQFEEGTPGQERSLSLELKLIADVGLVGLPNAGKSTLLSRLSKAKPKIADYPFTTLKPQLGIVELSDGRRFVMADIPGLIEGAHQGAGLGDEFLKHIERTRIVLHVVDIASDLATMAPEKAYATIRRELSKYSTALAEKPEIVAANKTDLCEDDDQAEDFAKSVGSEVLPISAASGKGVGQLAERLWQLVRSEKDDIPAETEEVELPVPPHLRSP